MEDKVAKESILLTDSQITELERKKIDDEASGEIETHYLSYLGSQDTFYLGNLESISWIYQQTFADTYSKVAFAKLYTSKTPITLADLLNNKVLPFFIQQQLPMLRILTDVVWIIAAAWISTIISCISPSTILITPRQKRNHRKPTASVSDSINDTAKVLSGNVPQKTLCNA